MANERAELPVEMDANTAGIRSAFEYIEREIAKVKNAVNAIGKDAAQGLDKAGGQLAQHLRELSQLQKQLGSLNKLVAPDLKKAQQEAKGFFQAQEQERKESLSRQAAAEREGQRLIQQINRQGEQQRLDSAKLSAKARIEGVRAEITENRKLISSLDEAKRLREASGKRTSDLRAQARAAVDPNQQRMLETKLRMEKYVSSELDKQIKLLEGEDRLKERQVQQSYRLLDAETKLRQQRQRDYDNALKSLNTTKTTQESRMYATDDLKKRAAARAKLTEEEKAGERAVMEMNRQVVAEEKKGIEGLRALREASTRQQLEQARAVRQARFEATRDDVRQSALSITSERELAEARAKNIADLRRYREAQKSVNDPNQLSALRTLISLEETRARALRETGRALEANAKKLAGATEGNGSKIQKLLIPGNVRDAAQKSGDPKNVLIQMQLEQELARRQLINASQKEEIAIATKRLELANAAVAAAQRLVQQEERQLGLEREIARGNRTEQQKAQIALARQYAETQVKSLGQAEALKIARQKTAEIEAKLAASTGVETAELREQLQLARAQQREIEKLTGARERSVGDRTKTALFNTALYGGAAALIYNVVGAARDGVQFVLDFEDSLVKLQAISGSTEGQLQVLKASIYEVAESSRYSTLEISEAATALAQAGFSARAIAESLKAASDLASASGSTVSEATDLLTSAVGSFQLQEGETGRVADTLVAALNRTKLTTQQVALGIQYAGQTAFEQNLTFEDLTATMGAMAQAGIRSGSTIGTGLRQFLVDLQSPSEKLTGTLKDLGLTFADINVKTLGLPAVLQNLRNAGFGSAEAYGALETRAAAAYLVMSNNVDLINKLTIEQAQQNVAADAAAKTMNSLTAQWQQFKNVTSEAFEKGFGNFTPYITSMLRAYNENQKFRNSIEDINKAADDGKLTFEQAVQLINDRREAMERANEAQQANAEGIEAANTAYATATDEVVKQNGVLNSLEQAIERVNQRQGVLKDGSLNLQAETATLTSRFQGLAQYLDSTANSYDGLTNALARYQQQELRMLATKLQVQETTAQAQGSANLQAARTSGTLINRLRGTGRLSNELLAQFDIARGATGANDAQRRAASLKLSDLSRKVGNEDDKRLVQSFVGQFANFVSSRDTERSTARLRRTATFASGDAQAGDRNRVNSLSKPGTSQATVRKTVAYYEGLSAGAKTPEERDFYAGLADQARGNLGSPVGSAAAKKAAEKAAKKAEREQKKRDREAARAVNQANRADFVAEKAGVTTADKELKNALADAQNPLSLEAIANGREKVDAALKEYGKQRLEAMEAEIKAKGLKGDSEKTFREAVAGELKAKAEEVQRALNKTFQDYINDTLEIAKSALARGLRPGDLAVDVQQGRENGLGLYSNRNRVPDYVKQLQEQRTQQEQEAALRASVAPKQQYADALGGALGDSQNELARLRSTGASQNVIDQQAKSVAELADQFQKANDELTVLRATLNSEDVLPRNFNEAVQQAIEAYRNANDLGRSLEQTLIMNVGGAINEVSGGLTTMFTSIFTGSQSALAAFGNFARGIGNYLTQLAAQFVANQVLNQLFGLIGLGAGAGAGAGNVAAAGTAGTVNVGARGVVPFANFATFNGGAPANGIHGAINGGRVMNGSPARDSVISAVAKDEWVVRKQAVDSVGHGFMADLNKRGAAAVASRASISPIVGPVQKTGVYVVLPGQQPQAGPNDFVLAVAQDMLQGGETAKLVKMITNNG